jgi:two-component system, cell cycle sensor histidine kinase and response regulator CckA
MKSPIHIMYLEDDPDDAELIQATLEAHGIACTIERVQNEVEFVAALEKGGIDLILSDYSLPKFDGLSALKIAQAMQPDIPFILVSATLGEDQAIDSLKSGATDYVLKSRLSRLAPAVRRALHDVEERAARRLLEARSIESQKIDVIGQLAGGVAHDFNNILGVVMGYSDLIAAESVEGSSVQQHNELIRLAANRAAGLTRQLLIFSRKQTVQPVVLDLNAEVKSMDTMLRRLIHENIEMIVVPAKQASLVKADSGYVGQVLMNLVINARDAMPNGGNLVIEIMNVTLDENDGRTGSGKMASEFVVLSVSDTGTGMTQEVKSHLFEAFFTTKPSGKGTGLGLTTCQTIVQQSGGHIDVYSEIGEGTTFKIYFPRIEQPLDSSLGLIQPAPMPRGSETLLVAEDEPSVRHLACAVLKAQGYQVLSATNGQDALHVAREHKGSPIRLVVTDVIMPQMGGKVMADWMKTANPDLKVLFTSGYMNDTIMNNGEIETGTDFLPKPYTPSTLSRKVREMLDRSNAQQPDSAPKTSNSMKVAHHAGMP